MWRILYCKHNTSCEELLHAFPLSVFGTLLFTMTGAGSIIITKNKTISVDLVPFEDLG